MRRRRKTHIFRTQGRTGEKFRYGLDHIEIAAIFKDTDPELAIIHLGGWCEIAKTPDGIGQHDDNERRAVDVDSFIVFYLKQIGFVILQGFQTGQEIGTAFELGDLQTSHIV